jgi:hypothetical protein
LKMIMEADDFDQVITISKVSAELIAYLNNARHTGRPVHVFGRPYTVVKSVFESVLETTQVAETEEGPESTQVWRIRVALKDF